VTEPRQGARLPGEQDAGPEVDAVDAGDTPEVDAVDAPEVDAVDAPDPDPLDAPEVDVGDTDVVDEPDATGDADGAGDAGSLGNPRIADAVARLQELGDAPPEAHVEVYEELHQVLQETLSDA
jgi:hypothetical protein